MAEYIVSSGEVSSGIILNNADSMTVLDGGMTNSITVDSKSSMFVLFGGTANNTILNPGDIYFYYSGRDFVSATTGAGKLYVSSGGVANIVTINAFGLMQVSSGGTVNSATVNSEGTMHVSGGTANSTMVNSLGMAVVFSGGTANATRISNGRMDIRSGGTANSTTIKGSLTYWVTFDSGTLHVSEGGEAVDAEVSAGGILFVSSGGIVNRAAVNSKASMFISSGGTAYGILENGGYVSVEDGANVSFLPNTLSGWNPGDSPTVHAGTVVDNAVVHQLYVYSGGIVNNTSVVNELVVYSGGVANYVSGERLLVVSNGGVVNYASAGSMYISSGGTAKNNTVKKNNGWHVCSGGILDNTTILSMGSLNASGGILNNTTVSSGGYLKLSDGILDNTTVCSRGSLNISGCTANSTTINAGGYMNVSGGTANYTTVSGSIQYVSSNGILYPEYTESFLCVYGGTINHTSLDGYGRIIVSGGIVDDLTVSSDCTLVLDAGTSATNIMLSSGAYMIFTVAADTYVCGMSAGSAFEINGPSITSYTVKADGLGMNVASGGTADYTSVIGGCVNVYSGGVMNNTTLFYSDSFLYKDGDEVVYLDTTYGVLAIFSGGTANSTMVNFWGELFVDSGGTANSTMVNSRGQLFVVSGGMANGTIVNSFGLMHVSSGGTANSTVLNSGGSFIVSSGGTANSTILNSGGGFVVDSGASANGTILNSGGIFVVSSGGAMNETVIESCGRVFIASDGTATGTIVSSGGHMHVSSGGNIASSTLVRAGGKLTGYFKYKDVTFDSGSVLYLDVSDEVSDNPEAFVDLDGYSGSQDAPSCAILIADSQKLGTYKIAGNAGDFNRTISIVNNVAELATISIGNTVEINGNDYTLALNDGDLVLSVRSLDPQYVYLDFDGETEATFSNSALDLSFSLSVQDPGFSEMQKQNILSGLSEQYGRNGIIFTLERPEDAEYSTLYFGKSDAFNDYGDFFGIAEAYDGSNQHRDDAFVLLNRSYSDGQILSVACNMMDRIMGYSCLKYDDTDIKKYAQSRYLLSTKWNQDYPYNKYCPIDPVVEKRSAVGCINTAAAQIINYWLENGMLDFTLSLEDSDAYESIRNTVITIDSSDSPAAGYLSFAETNRLLANYEPGNEDSIAALSFAVGVAQKANYSTGATSTAWWEDLFYRSGFERTFVESYNDDYSHLKPEDFIDPDWDVIIRPVWPNGGGYSDDDYIIRELLQGRPVGALIHRTPGSTEIACGHAIVIDGYDSSSGMFHLNFGWGGISDRWYTRDSLDYMKISYTYTGIAPIVFPDLEVGNLSANADHVYLNDDITLRFTVSNEGSESTASFAYVYNGDELLGWTGFSHISPGESRNVACTVSASALPVGENTLTVKVYTQKEEDSVSSASLTIRHSGEERPDVPIPKNLVGMAEQVSWDMTGAEQYIVEYSTDNFEHVVSVVTAGDAIDIFDLPEETYQWRVKAADIDEWAVGNEIVAEKKGDAPQLVKSDADGNADVFFANAADTWKSAYLAQHVGSIGDWSGTNEYAALYGKNKLADIIEGSTDANILLMTDDENGDTLFVDDIYTASHGDLAEKQSRIAQIDEIRAGAGNDIVDMTSQRFEYVGDGLTIRGGAGNDVIWANKGDNRLFGDAGNDRIVGASGSDVIAGGIGNDRMHGGGGSDVFTFCDNWGTDNVDQLAGGSVTLWFASGSMENWDAETLTYMDGENSVKVSGVALDKITLKFSDDGSAQFASLTSMGAFLDATTERIFEESGKGILASLGGGASTAAVPG